MGSEIRGEENEEEVGEEEKRIESISQLFVFFNVILAYFCCPIKIRHPFYFTQHRKKIFFFAFDSSFPSLFFHPYPLLPFFYPVSETPPTNLAEKNKKKKT